MTTSKFIIERSLLEKGDIILTGNKTVSSLGVRAATLSRYSHAAIYVGGTTIEATLEGVFSLNPQRMLFDRATDAAVLRSRTTLSEEQIKMVCSFAQSKVGSLYALNEAITIRARSLLRVDETNRQFCSRLVANSYAHIGFDFINLRNPAYCTPRQLGLCKAFRKVDGITRQATVAEIAFAETPDPNRENLRQTFEWLNKVRALVKTKPDLVRKIDIQTIQDVGTFLMEHPEYDSEISDYVEKSGYLDFYNTDTLYNPYRYNKEYFLLQLRHIANKEQFLTDEISKEDRLVERYCGMLQDYIDKYKIKKLNFFKINIRLYINLITGIHVRTDVLSHVFSELGYHTSANELHTLANVLLKVIQEGESALKV
ncbi:hypothetical protein DK254_23000 [Pseudomonas sp. RW407]|uniref:YiiX/YebB-like N1pC/P60 family cysteine hydrolase n=1 Tax=Pseudomonas sp. RW407 TaxID=2202894 RepID=UPI000D6F5B8C|nr:YiiX/YebB-like N1pC/P60 family cysteine hydrolase [Pseudomonas sp. RW407]PWU28677.1 hypothetical protein DK254_23000 [Pseudomonas sp. RW407]